MTTRALCSPIYRTCEQFTQHTMVGIPSGAKMRELFVAPCDVLWHHSRVVACDTLGA
jgi:hypothetical protein